MQGILIDPKAHTVTLNDEYDGDFKTIYRIIGADLFDCVRIDDSETIYVDDEGLLNGKAASDGFFYVIGDNPVAIAGRGLILATDDEGDSIATTLTVEKVNAMVRFGHLAKLVGRVAFFATDGHVYPLPE